MALPTGRSDREYKKFVQRDDGQVAVAVDIESADQGGGGGSGGGLSTYYAKPSGTNADATSAYASATTLTVTGLPYTFTAFDIVSIDQYNSSNVFQSSFKPKTDTITVSGTTITVAGAAFSSGDQFVVTFALPPKTIDEANDAQDTQSINPLWSRYSSYTLADVTNETNATNNRYIDMVGYDGLVIQYEKTGGTDSVTLTVEATAQDDGTAAASCTYQDITQYGMGISTASATSASYTADAIINLSDGYPYRYIKVKTVSAGGNNNADYAIYIRKFKR